MEASQQLRKFQQEFPCAAMAAAAAAAAAAASGGNPSGGVGAAGGGAGGHGVAGRAFAALPQGKSCTENSLLMTDQLNKSHIKVIQLNITK